MAQTKLEEILAWAANENRAAPPSTAGMNQLERDLLATLQLILRRILPQVGPEEEHNLMMVSREGSSYHWAAAPIERLEDVWAEQGILLVRAPEPEDDGAVLTAYRGNAVWDNAEGSE